jgi:hypothetical protein
VEKDGDSGGEGKETGGASLRGELAVVFKESEVNL